LSFRWATPGRGLVVNDISVFTLTIKLYHKLDSTTP
jgi:hypothetical protein